MRNKIKLETLNHPNTVFITEKTSFFGKDIHMWIDVEDKIIKIYNEDFYQALKEYGDEHRYNELIKCWEGCENE